MISAVSWAEETRFRYYIDEENQGPEMIMTNYCQKSGGDTHLFPTLSPTVTD